MEREEENGEKLSGIERGFLDRDVKRSCEREGIWRDWKYIRKRHAKHKTYADGDTNNCRYLISRR